MKCIKCLIVMYSVLILTAISWILVACTTNKDRGYSFDIASYDKTSRIDKHTLDSLFINGVTVKEFEHNLYYIQNTIDNNLKINDSNIIDFGPITINRVRNQTFNDFYCLNIEESNDEFSSVKLTINLTSKFKGSISKIEFKPAWLAYSTTEGLYNVVLLTPLSMSFDNLSYNDKFNVDIPWKCYSSLIQNDFILVSVKLKCYLKGTNKYFTEVINLAVNKSRNI